MIPCSRNPASRMRKRDRGAKRSRNCCLRRGLVSSLAPPSSRLWVGRSGASAVRVRRIERGPPGRGSAEGPALAIGGRDAGEQGRVCGGLRRAAPVGPGGLAPAAGAWPVRVAGAAFQTLSLSRPAQAQCGRTGVPLPNQRAPRVSVLEGYPSPSLPQRVACEAAEGLSGSQETQVVCC